MINQQGLLQKGNTCHAELAKLAKNLSAAVDKDSAPALRVTKSGVLQKPLY